MKNQVRNIRHYFHTLRRKFGLVFYLHQQRYRIAHHVRVKNISDHTIAVSIVLPIPSSNDYQKVLANPLLSPASAKIHTDATFGNRYAVWAVSIDAHSELVFQQQSQLSVHPRRNESDSKKKFRLEDYQTNDPLYRLYIRHNRHIPGNEDRFKKLAKNIIGEETDIRKIISLLNEYVINNLNYGNPIEGLYTADDAVTKKQVDCGGFDTLLATLCISLGIPARIVSGFWAGYGENRACLETLFRRNIPRFSSESRSAQRRCSLAYSEEGWAACSRKYRCACRIRGFQTSSMHAWVEFLLPDASWFVADPSVEYLVRKNETRKTGWLGFTGSDRIVLSVGCDVPLEINDHTEYADILQNPILVSKNKEFLRAEAEFLISN